MIQRTFLTPFRVAGASIRIASRSIILRPQYRTNNASIVQRLRPIPAARWYATEPEQHKAPEGESQIAGEAPKESMQVEDVAKKELEAKNKEIIDLKVRPHADIFRYEDQSQCRD
jgi:molecular chaperone GrpE